jgi:hypothetical protein
LTHDYRVPALRKWLTAYPAHTLRRIWQWYRKNPASLRLTAGGYMALQGATLVLWDLFGIMLFVTGIHPVERPLRGVVELLGLLVFVYLPIALCGIATLNGGRRALVAGTICSAAGAALCVVIMFNLFPPLLDLEALRSARDNTYVRLQLTSILGIGCLAGLVVHILGLLSLRGRLRP